MYKIDLSQLSNIADDTPCLTREVNFPKKESVGFDDINSTYCEFTEESQQSQSMCFSLKFDLEIDNEIMPIIHENKDSTYLGSSFGKKDTPKNQANYLIKSNSKKTISVQTENQLIKYRQGFYKNHSIYKETIERLEKKQKFRNLKKQPRHCLKPIIIAILLMIFSLFFFYCRGIII